ncbi:MAG: hypothetical protein HFP81_08235 [Methylococcales symbiont of Hymedesmia sp. n. MRB-2018]|nr:MAG: hypothetical protein HFP81_08235 [Methylococcales symbiont of Hymedesmia sp. n. MRB-2018]
MSQGGICGVLLNEDAYKILGKVLEPYVKEGSIGKYIYCNTAQQNGYFLDMTFKPEMCDGSIEDEMRISVPLTYVEFIVSGDGSLPIGFIYPEPTSGQS